MNRLDMSLDEVIKKSKSENKAKQAKKKPTGIHNKFSNHKKTPAP